MQINLFESKKSHFLLPLSYFRHVADLEIGITSIAKKWEKAGFNVNKIGRTYLCTNQHQVSLFVNAQSLPTENLISVIKNLESNVLVTYKYHCIAFKSNSNVLDSDGFLDLNLLQSFNRIELNHIDFLEYPWSLVEKNSAILKTDGLDFSENIYKNIEGVFTLNKDAIFIGKNVKILPGTVLNAESGPIVIDDGAIISATVYLEGPVYIGKKAQIKAHARIAYSSIHSECRAAGEIANSIMYSCANKAHDGYLGHSILGEFSNLGAMSTTSNLKNNYSNVNVDYFGKKMQLETMFLGLIMGDHSKSAIGTMFNTATICGTNSNIFGNGSPLKFIPSFSWGSKDINDKYEFEKALETAKIVLTRRNIKVDSDFIEKFKAVYKMGSEN